MLRFLQFFCAPPRPLSRIRINVTRSKIQRQTHAACTGTRGRLSCGNTRFMHRYGGGAAPPVRPRGNETACHVARFAAGGPGRRSAVEGFRWARIGDGTVSCGGPLRHHKLYKLGPNDLTAPEEGPNWNVCRARGQKPRSVRQFLSKKKSVVWVYDSLTLTVTV